MFLSWRHTSRPGRTWAQHGGRGGEAGAGTRSLRTHHGQAPRHQLEASPTGCSTLPAALGVRGSLPFPRRETEAPRVLVLMLGASTLVGPQGRAPGTEGPSGAGPVPSLRDGHAPPRRVQRASRPVPCAPATQAFFPPRTPAPI